METRTFKSSLPPRVTPTQWGLVIISLLLAWLSRLFDSYDDLRWFASVLTVLNLFLLVNVAFEALRTRVLGKTLVVGSTLVMFWLEALAGSVGRQPFLIPQGVLAQDTQFSVALVQQSFLYVAMFQAFLLVGYSFRPRMAPVITWARSRVDRHSGGSWLLRLALASCALVPFLYAYGFDLGNAREALVSARSGLGPAPRSTEFIQYLYFFGMYGAAFFLAEGIVFRRQGRLWYLSLGILFALPFIMLGARHHWLFVALPSVIVGAGYFLRRVTPGRMAKLSTLTLLLVVVIQVQFAVRGVGWDKITTVDASDLLRGDTTGQFTALLYAQYLVPDYHEYFMEPAEPFFVLHWVPRPFWPDKPIMGSWQWYNNAYTGGSDAFNVTPSVIGQFHINWGILGVVAIGLWIGFLTYLADRLLAAIDIERQRAMAVALGIFYAFIVAAFRFYSPIYFTFVPFAVVSMLLLTSRQQVDQSSPAQALSPVEAPAPSTP